MCPVLWFFLAAVLLLPCGAPAQTPISGSAKKFKWPDYYPATSPTQTNRVLKTLLSGEEARQLPNNRYQITGLRIESFREDGQPELEVRAADCVLDLAATEASSPAHLEVVSASGLYAVAGEGFLWRQSDSLLVISNHVTSTLHRGLLQERSPGPEAATNAAPAFSGEAVRITSDRGVFNNQSNLLTQSGHVVADDPQMQLGCEVLTIRFTPARGVQEIAADQDVTVLNKADQSRATSGQGVYVLAPGREAVTLTRNAVWHDRDARQQVKANVFTYDLRNKAIRAEGQAAMWLPRGGVAQPSLGLEPRPPATPAPEAGTGVTNQIQITSDVLTILLATTNRPQRTATAETNVVLLSPADHMRATGDKAVYSEATGLIELAGRTRWEAEGRVLNADVLTMDRTNRVFRGHGHVNFKLPLSQAGRAGALRVPAPQTGSTNLFLHVASEEMIYETNRLVFLGSVRARFLDAEVLRGVVTCELLTARFSDRLESLLARKHVMAEHYPPPGAGGKSVTNLLSCGLLSAQVSKIGQIVALVAAENVQAAQLEVSPGQTKPVLTELTCEMLTAVLLPGSGVVDKLHAEQHVVISKEDKTARGGDAIYTASENRVELTDNPYAEFAEGKITDADILLWDRNTGKFRGGGKYRIQWTKPPGGTNRSLFISPKK